MNKHLAVRADNVTLQIAQHAIWLDGDENNGVQPGEYTTKLWALITKADEENLELLRMIYPGYVEAFEALRRTSWGRDWLRRKVMDVLVGAL